MNPLRAVGLIRRWEPGAAEHGAYLGSCFAYRWQNRFLTAAHCVAGLPPSSISIETAGGLTSTISGLVQHPTADIAIMEPFGGQIAGRETHPFEIVTESYGLGEEIMAFGYPVDVLGPSGIDPVPRLFKGYFQRFIEEYRAYTGFRYRAAELNFACPRGLSGGPIFRPGAQNVVLGLATENLRSTTSLDGLETRNSRSETVTIEYREVISYGTALMLSAVSDWLDTYCPPYDMSERAASLGVRLDAQIPAQAESVD